MEERRFGDKLGSLTATRKEYISDCSEKETPHQYAASKLLVFI
jgi:hypothetical protein